MMTQETAEINTTAELLAELQRQYPQAGAVSVSHGMQKDKGGKVLVTWTACVWSREISEGGSAILHGFGLTPAAALLALDADIASRGVAVQEVAS